MPYRLLITRDIKEQLRGLPGNIKAVARQQIAGLADDPRPSQSRELAGHNGHYRLHLGPQYRLVWQVIESEKIVEIEYVGPKPPGLYEKLGLARPKPVPPKDE
ncbi:MAG: hypothetical protein HYY33_06790 [Chloroflexi bacterium]|nr:hypothetical protein [Chloroflexota bacterium]MBI2976642.1 hypothetical protein [Chloroflexota bacterium]